MKRSRFGVDAFQRIVQQLFCLFQCDAAAIQFPFKNQAVNVLPDCGLDFEFHSCGPWYLQRVDAPV